MKNLKMLISIIILTMIVTCTGCNGESEEPVNIAFVVGIANNQRRLNEGITELTTLPAKPNSSYAFISIDGTPSCILSGKIPDLTSRGYSDQMMERVRAGIHAELVQKLNDFQPDAPQIDLAKATELAVRTLHANAQEDKTDILVYYCSGVSTYGLINMVETPISRLDIEASAKSIAQSMDLSLQNIDVYFYGCGDVGEGQPELSTEEKKGLRTFYETFFNASGARSVNFKDNLPSEESYHFEKTEVTPMPVEGTVSGMQELVELDSKIFENTSANVLEKPFAIPETKISYKPDTAEFTDPEMALEVLKPVAAYLKQNPSINILIYGTCAGDQVSDFALNLGQNRAQSVKDILLTEGISNDRITTISVRPEDDPFYKFGLGTGEEAQVNRKTVLVDRSTPLAQDILSKTSAQEEK